MKKLILSFILIPTLVVAKFNPGNISFNNGTNKIGFIEAPEYKDKKIKFKSEENGKVEKYNIDDVKDFQIQNDKNETENYTTLIVGTNKLFNLTKFNLDSKKSFVKIIKQGKISVYSIHFQTNTGSGMKNYYVGSDAYYLQREKENFAFGIGIHRYDLSFMVGMDLYQVAKINFKEICPNFAELIKVANLNSNEFYKIVDIYEQNCGQK
jgi:hypothetical protein